jgi:hypothetical protein
MVAKGAQRLVPVLLPIGRGANHRNGCGHAVSILRPAASGWRPFGFAQATLSERCESKGGWRLSVGGLHLLDSEF